MIALRCSCGKKLQVPDRMAGRKGKCPACGEPVPVPRAGFVDDEGETVASDNSPLELSDDPVQPKSRPPAPAAAAAASAAARHAAAPAISCPRCRAAYASTAIFCPQCAVDLRTGQPVAGVVPGHMSAPRASRQESPFRDFLIWLFYSRAGRLLLAAILLLAAYFFIRPILARNGIGPTWLRS